MSWLFSQALVEACLPPNSLETEPCAQLNVMPTPHQFWRNDKTMEPSRFSRFGLTCAALTEDRGAELLTAWLAGFHARTSAQQDQEPDLMASALDSGASLPASFARWSPQLFGWKTAQCSLLEDSSECLETLPRWGSMRNGMLYLRQTLAPGISAIGSGSLLPTLTVCGNYNAKGASPTSGDGLATVLKKLPTLLASDGSKGGPNQARGSGSLSLPSAVARLPTLVADDTGMRKSKYAQGGTPLSLAVSQLPMLTTIGLNGGSNSRAAREKAGESPTHSGPLNPDWCEWFMGFPIGWTASSALAMPKFHEWQQQHSPLLPSSSKEAA